METKPLLYGLIGFFLGGLLVSIAATTFDKQEVEDKNIIHTSMGSMSMDEMASDLQGKTGDDYDKAFIEMMIAHHQGAIDMAKLSDTRAKHEEIKQLSNDIIKAQEKEIAEMKQWQQDWNYSENEMMHEGQ